MSNFWSEKKARWYNEALKYSDYPERIMEVVLPLIKGCHSALDIGAGCGALTIPLAKKLKKITALEPSQAMMGVLKEEAGKQGLRNIECIEAEWPHLPGRSRWYDIVISANVPGSLMDSEGFIRGVERLAKRYVFFIQGVDPHKDKFFYKELYPIIFKKEYPPRDDYLGTYSLLHSLRIYANVAIVEYNFDQRFRDLDGVVDFWKEHMSLKTSEFDETLREFLKGKLERFRKGYVLRIYKKSAVMWWEPSPHTYSVF